MFFAKVIIKNCSRSETELGEINASFATVLQKSAVSYIVVRGHYAKEPKLIEGNLNLTYHRPSLR